ncbi:glycosyltransferase [Sphingobium sufflavum]|uniref:glycosyltransferase family 2 protein n=1 Tax=Sphingobium sufflavum TaxID=1129547 RepID=UPI001F2CCCF3|nr:glycosyltransferase [Sphingobium sufflavum]MCE7798394.1 glycosyltransferase [Sphingobium sufflavum]
MLFIIWVETLKSAQRLMERIYIFGLALKVDPRTALEGLMWRLRGKVVRSRNMVQKMAARHPRYYPFWIKCVEAVSCIPLGEARNGGILWPITVLILIDQEVDQGKIKFSIASVQGAFGANARFEVICSPKMHGTMAGCRTLRQALHQTGSEAGYIVPLFAGDELARNAERILQQAIVLSDAADVIYWDEDRLDSKGERAEPWMKPDWDALQFATQDYVSGAAMIRTDCAKALMAHPLCHGEVQLDILFAVAVLAKGSGRPWHVEHVLIHRRGPDARQDGDRAINILKILGEPAEIGAVIGHGVTIVRWPFPKQPPSVSILVPIRDHVDLLKTCMAGLQMIDYPGDIEIIVIDNDSEEESTKIYLKMLASAGVTILPQSGEFNYARINNRAVEQARGDFICLLNNDVEMLDGDWLGLMMRHAVRSDIAAVGAKLLYPDRTIQHAGVAIGLGGAAGHLHRHVANDDWGYFGQPHISRHVTAVTAACLLVEKAKFLAVNGLDAENFPVAFNDIDLCLKFVRHGWHNVYCPEAILIHHESKSRGSDMAPENYERFSKELANLRRLWGTEIYKDPYLNGRFSRRSEGLYLELNP